MPDDPHAMTSTATTPAATAATARSFVVIGGRASASDDFRLDDLPSSSGRLDALVRCIRAALLVSHGVRRDVRLYLVLRGGPRAPRTVRIDGRTAAFLRPDERSLATLLKKALATDVDGEGGGFAIARPGIAIARGDLDVALADVGESALFVLEEGAPDAREDSALGRSRVAFVLGDHLGFDEGTRASLARLGATPRSVGPRSLHTEDVVTLIVNELDRHDAKAAPCAS
jgi:tRNA (pseudouridine54-N1)-methyltransferase